MADILEWERETAQQTLPQIAQVLMEGRVVVFPTDTSYIAAASAMHPDAVQHLADGRFGTQQTYPIYLTVRGEDEALEWIPHLSRIGRRFARRCWPGPLTMNCSLATGNSLFDQLPQAVQAILLRDDRLVLGLPCHEGFLYSLRLLATPLVYRELVDDSGNPITNGEAAIAQAGSAADLVLTGGNTYFEKIATLVQIETDSWKLVREGPISQEVLEHLTGCQIVFICTGNTCRSPMAAALCKKILAEQIGCTPDDLPARGIHVQSAGLAAMEGMEATPEAIQIGEEMGVDLRSHRSQPLTGDVLASADYVLTMTESHLQAILPYSPSANPQFQMLSSEGVDIMDPIGGETEIYRQCGREILQHLIRRLPELQLI